VAGEAAVDEIETLAVPGIAWRSVLGLQEGQSTKAESGRCKRRDSEAFEVFHCEFLSAGR
jgi:hypothetical protein